jgi:hypothetical protein
MKFELHNIAAMNEEADKLFGMANREPLTSARYSQLISDAERMAREASEREDRHIAAREALRARFETFDEEAKDSGLINASDTMRENGIYEPAEHGFRIPAWVLDTAEYWSIAVESAQSIVDFRS